VDDLYEYDENEFEDFEDGEEWQPGQCCNCSGYVPEPNDPPLTPACACAIGQGASPEDCVCGPLEDQ
jgi:hypothetical protein